MRALAVLDGAIVCALALHVLHAFVTAPAWLECATAITISVCLLRSGRLGALTLCFGVGVGLGFGLPSAVPAPSAVVVTHGAPMAHGADLFDALAALDEDPQALDGHRITVTGTWRPAQSSAPAAVFRQVMACCAADALDVGFDVFPAGRVTLSAGIPVRVSGIVDSAVVDGEMRYRLRGAIVSGGSNGGR